MTLPEIQKLGNTVDQLTNEGLHDSAFKVVSDTVRKILLGPYELDSNAEFLAHYTNVDALFSMLSCPVETDSRFALSSRGPVEEQLDKDSSFLRMYDTFTHNDPQEGQFFLNARPSSHRFSKEKYAALWKFFLDRSSRPAYVTSFRAVPKRDKIDNLVFWRTYGEEGQGCAIVFPKSFISSATPLRVQYGSKPVRSMFERVMNVFDSLDSLQSLEKIEHSGANVPIYITPSLSPIPYLHKSDYYKFESEVRVVVPFDDLSDEKLFCHRIHHPQSGLKLRHFATHPDLHVRNILRSDSTILLGPAVREGENVEFVLKRRLENVGLVGTRICQSKISFRSRP